jgi:hypothetical protein
MLAKLADAFLLLALTVLIHAAGMTASLRWLRHSTARMDTRFWFSTWLLVRIAAWIILLHLVEIAIWAFFYTWKHGMPDLQSALYFSAVTYTTTGYGDLLLPKEWRLIGGVEALTGILMCGWSTAFFFIVASKLYGVRLDTKQN